MRLLLCTIGLATTVAAGSAIASPAATILHADGGSVVERTATGKKRSSLASLPVSLGQVMRVDVAAAGNVLMVVARDRVLRIDLSSARASTTLVECQGQATLSADGACIACARGKRGVEMHRFAATPRLQRFLVAAERVALRGTKASEIIAVRGRNLWSYHGAKPHQLLAPHAPDGPWLVAPNGKRAAGVYGAAGAAAVLYTFKLDGKGIKRRLLRGARPVAWSGDSRWLLVQSAGSACIVRAMGGQYKCWSGYNAVAISRDGGHALLAGTPKDAKHPALYVGVLSGARPIPPSKIVDPFAGSATWRTRGTATTSSSAVRR